MALRIGKKKTDSPAPSGAPAPEDFSDFGNIPEETPQPSVPAAPVKPAKAPKSAGRGPSKALLGALGAVLLVGGGAAAYILTSSGQTEEDAATPTALPNPKPASDTPDAAPTTAAKPDLGARGIAPNGAQSPNVKPAIKGQPPRMVPAKGSPTPIQPPTGPSASPGQSGARNEVRIVKPAVATGKATSGKMTKLKQLWNEGRDAKHRNDYAAARSIWNTGLQLANQSPKAEASAKGFRDSIAQLPK